MARPAKMKHRMKVRTTLAALLAIIITMVCWSSAFAASAVQSQLLPGTPGSITVTVVTSGNEIIPGGTLRLYYVAALSEAGAFSLNPAFADSGLDLKKAQFTKEDSDSVCAYAERTNAPYTTAAVDNSGEARFKDLANGLYLIAQDETAQGYLPILPFLVLMPTIKDGAAIYNVACSPKPVDKVPALSIPLIAEKEVLSLKDSKAPSDTPFTFVLTPAASGQPMPSGAAAGASSQSVTRKGAGSVDFGVFNFTEADAGKTYVYTMKEVNGGALHYTYDTTVYTITYELYMDENGQLACRRTATDEGGKLLDEIVFSNEYAPNYPDIPRTGQLWWPVAAMAAAGFVLVLAGLICRRKEEA